MVVPLSDCSCFKESFYFLNYNLCVVHGLLDHRFILGIHIQVVANYFRVNPRHLLWCLGEHVYMFLQELNQLLLLLVGQGFANQEVSLGIIFFDLDFLESFHDFLCQVTTTILKRWLVGHLHRLDQLRLRSFLQHLD